MRSSRFLLFFLLTISFMELRCGEEQETLPEGGILWAKGMDSYRISALNVFDGSGLRNYGIEIVENHDISSFSVDSVRGSIWLVDRNDIDTIYKFNRSGVELGSLVLNIDNEDWIIENIGAIERDGGCWINYRRVGNTLKYYWGRLSSGLYFLGGNQVPVEPGETDEWVVNKLDGSLWFSCESDIYKWDINLNEVGVLQDLGEVMSMDVDEERGYLWVWVRDEEYNDNLVRVDSQNQRIELFIDNPFEKGCEDVFLVADENDGGVFTGGYFRGIGEYYQSWIYKFDSLGNIIRSIRIFDDKDEDIGLWGIVGSEYDGSLFVYGWIGAIPTLMNIDSGLTDIGWYITWIMGHYTPCLMEVDYNG